MRQCEKVIESERNVGEKYENVLFDTTVLKYFSTQIYKILLVFVNHLDVPFRTVSRGARVPWGVPGPPDEDNKSEI